MTADPSVPVIFFQDGLVPADEAPLSPFDRGLQVGDGVFETLLAYRGEPFAAAEHHARLVRSAGVMGLRVPAEKTILEAMREVLVANGLHLRDRARLRVTVTGGPGAIGSGRDELTETLLVAASEAPRHGPESDVLVVPWTRNEKGALAGVKSVSYGENVVALALAKKHGADEAILGNTAGNLCEGTGSNVFVRRGDTLVTPPLSSGCLDGITRAIAIDCARAAGIACVEEDLPLEVLTQADAVFLTSTTREIQPVRSVNGEPSPQAPEWLEAWRREFAKRLPVVS